MGKTSVFEKKKIYVEVPELRNVTKLKTDKCTVNRNKFYHSRQHMLRVSVVLIILRH